MICDLCKGKGWVQGQAPDIPTACSACGGKGFVEQTNEEWFCQLPTEEKAKVLRRRTYGNSEDNESVEQGWVNWLKAKHEDNPPDIPSVPSWDKWLQGERTKCTYCDGTNAECNLAGRFECPRTPKTEQEYIQTCTTEQLAEELLAWWIDGADTYTQFGLFQHEIDEAKEKIVEWLKQPHTIKE